MRIVIGAPGNGAVSKDEIKAYLESDGRVSEVVDVSSTNGTYPQVSIAASKVIGVRAATAHDLPTVRGSVENYYAQILCMGQNVIASPAAKALVDMWLGLSHDPTSDYAPKLEEIAAYEAAG